MKAFVKDPTVLNSEKKVSNVETSATSPKIWMIDNEFGFKESTKTNPKRLLKSFCVFQKKTVKQLWSLAKEETPFEVIKQFAIQHDPVINNVNKDYWQRLISNDKFATRLNVVMQWFEECEKGVLIKP